MKNHQELTRSIFLFLGTLIAGFFLLEVAFRLEPGLKLINAVYTLKSLAGAFVALSGIMMMASSLTFLHIQRTLMRRDERDIARGNGRDVAAYFGLVGMACFISAMVTNNPDHLFRNLVYGIMLYAMGSAIFVSIRTARKLRRLDPSAMKKAFGLNILLFILHGFNNATIGMPSTTAETAVRTLLLLCFVMLSYRFLAELNSRSLGDVAPVNDHTLQAEKGE